MTLVLKDRYLPIPPVAAIPRRFLVLGVALAVVVGAMVGTWMTFYRWHAHQGVARSIARWLPLPAGHVDGDVLWYRELSERANALEALAGVAAEDAFGQAVVRAQRDAVAAQLAAQLGVYVTDEEIAAFVAQDAELALLQSEAGWTARDYRRWGVAPYVLAEKLEEAVLRDASLQAYARGRVEKLVGKLEEGLQFADLALQYSEGDTAYLGGDLGFVDPTTLPEPLATAVLSLAVGDVSDILETDRAFWLLTVTERAEESGVPRVRVIEIKKDLLGEILTRALGTADVAVWLR